MWSFWTKGKLLPKAPLLQLKNTYTGDFLTLYGVTESQVPGLGAALFGHTGCISRVGFQHRSGNGTDCEASGAVRDYEITKGRMDDVFLAVTGKKLMGGMAE